MSEREQVTDALRMMTRSTLSWSARQRTARICVPSIGCKALMGQFGVGELTAVTILAELGDARRFSPSRDMVRYPGLDITGRRSDQRRASGHLSREGPPALRWALFEAAQSAAGGGSRPRVLRSGGRADRCEPDVPAARANF